MTDSTPAPDLARKARAAAWPVWLVVLAVALAFGSLCSAEFTWWDDAATVHHNERLNPPTLGGTAYYWTHAADGLWVPITYTAWAALAALARLDTPGDDGIALNPWVFHTANVLLHALASLAVLGLLRRLTKTDAAACAGALLFALHPVQVEAVAWVSGLKDVLAGGLGIAALLCYVEAAGRDRRDGGPWYALATLAFVAAMLAKPSAATVPLLAATIDWFLLRRPLRRVAWAAGPWLVLAVPVLVVARLAQGVESVANVALWARPLVMGDALAFYLYKLVWPLHLGVDYGRRPAVLLAQGGWIHVAWLVPLALAAALWLGRRRRPWLPAGGLLFAAALLPVSGLTTFQFQAISTTADHYLYLAMLGPALALAFALREYGGRVAWGLTSLVLVLLSVRTLLQTDVWRDDETLFGHALALNPDSGVAHNSLGQVYARRNEDERALVEFEAAVRARPDFPDPYGFAAVVYARAGDWRRATEMMSKDLDVRSRWPGYDAARTADGRVRIGRILLDHGEPAAAAGQFETALRVAPDHAEARELLDDARARSGSG